MTLAAGTRLGRYEIRSRLGVGGMGEVYLAQDTALDRKVAIKFLPESLTADKQARKRLVREAQAAAKLDHPNICSIYEVGEEDGCSFIVMQYLEGETLDVRMKRKPLDFSQSLSIATQVADALAEAHARGIIHRDIKPSNIIITPRGQAKVMDFGLAKSLSTTGAIDTEAATQSLLTAPGAVIGTVPYMSPEQVKGEKLDARTDIFSFGVMLYEMLSGRQPFARDSAAEIVAAILTREPPPLDRGNAAVPVKLEEIVRTCLDKDRARRYQTMGKLADALEQIRRASESEQPAPLYEVGRRLVMQPLYAVPAALMILLIVGAGLWYYQRSEKRRWAREQAMPEIARLSGENKPLAAFLLMQKAQQYSPGDPQLAQSAEDITRIVSIRSSPPEAVIEIKDYLSPDDGWFRLGTTPLEQIRIPKGYFRWRISKQGIGEYTAAPITEDSMDFELDSVASAPAGMVRVPSGRWGEYVDFIGWLGPYDVPPFYIDRFEVTNRQYQEFVDQGGYQKQEYWNQKFVQDGRELSWNEAMALLRDSTGRPGPSTWEAGHHAEGQADYPVAGVSWYEAAAYAAFADKSLPVISQWYMAAPPLAARYISPESNYSLSSPAPVGKFTGIGPYGTYDMAGNVAEWCWNGAGGNLRFILGGAFGSQTYAYYDPSALSPFDRSPKNGFRCVRNPGPLSSEITDPKTLRHRDFSKAKPASDEVFRIYQNLYAYHRTPLNAKVEAVVEDSMDWRKEKITFLAAYGSERMPAYLFLPKNVRPPYQVVVFFPSARVLDIPTSKTLGDMKFIDYVIKSGRAVMYPVYQGTYERRIGRSALPEASSSSDAREILVQRYKDLGRSIDYLESRSDINSSKIGYLGVSMGTAFGVILTTLEERLKAVVFLDGGFFQESPLPGTDQVDFAPRLKKPVLMINGRYDFVFSLEQSQLPMFRMLGTPEADKRHVALETPHDVTAQRTELVKEVLAWLDKYLGKID
jgi:serine/threonine protein kinase/dienelactone hydrolase